MIIQLEKLDHLFPVFCERIDADVDMDLALMIIKERANASPISRAIDLIK
jgi:hypothetical protein